MSRNYICRNCNNQCESDASRGRLPDFCLPCKVALKKQVKLCESCKKQIEEGGMNGNGSEQ